MLFLDQLTQSIGIVLNTIAANMRTEELLKQSQSLTIELQSQQEELQQTNEELEEKARLLAEQNEEVEKRTREIEEARRALEQKAEQLALTSKYKSQFLANMSHELRTPLNSLLILSKQLGDNKEQNLSGKQVEMAQTIRRSGSDLLTLINDILDLSKIESGTTSVDIAEQRISDICDDVERTFRGVAQERGLRFAIQVDDDVPEALETDQTRLMQILKNLLSNAFKFTSHGSVELTPAPRQTREIDGETSAVRRLRGARHRDRDPGRQAQRHLRGVPASRHVHGPQVRRHGPGPGDLARDRGPLGRRHDRRVGAGRRIDLHVLPPARAERPRHQRGGDAGRAAALQAVDGDDAPLLLRRQNVPVASEPVEDDRADVRPHDRVVLIIEDDATFARILLGLARDRGFSGLMASSGAEGLALARQFVPDAITLDIGLPDLDGWTLLDQLKRDPATKSIPVHVISGEEQWQKALDSGAFAHLKKPASEDALTQAFDNLLGFADAASRNVLVVEDDVTQLSAMANLIQTGEVTVTAVSTGGQALRALDDAKFDCIIVDLGLPDIDGIALIEQIKAHPAHARVPVDRLHRPRAHRAGGRRAAAPLRVGDREGRDVARAADRRDVVLPQPGRGAAARGEAPAGGHRRERVARRPHHPDHRRRHAQHLRPAQRARGLQHARPHGGVGRRGDRPAPLPPAGRLVLMDIMMPEMDGYETIRRIRARDEWKSLPIIALTAKAMKGDREQCLAAGASEYISKPVDIDQLVALIRVWLNVAA